MGIDTEYLEQLKATLTELKQIISALHIEDDGSINANVKGDVTIESISIKDASNSNLAKVDENGNLLVKTNIVQVDEISIKDSVTGTKAKVDSDGKLLIKNDLVQIDSLSIKDATSSNKAKVDADGKLLVKTDIIVADSLTIKDPLTNNKAQVDSNGRLLVSQVQNNNMIIVDANNSSQKAMVDTYGRLLVSTPPPQPPPNTIPVVLTAFGDVTADSDTTYTITNGKKLYLARLLAGSEETSKACRITLYEAPTGNLAVLNLIATLYVNGNSDKYDLSQNLDGINGRKIVLRRSNLGTGKKEIFARFEGYEE